MCHIRHTWEQNARKESRVGPRRWERVGRSYSRKGAAGVWEAEDLAGAHGIGKGSATASTDSKQDVRTPEAGGPGPASP